MNKFHKCPICKVQGEQLKENSLVYYHTTTDNRGAPLTHKWSVNSGRMFTLKTTEDDSVV
jgi:hypothetical protein